MTEHILSGEPTARDTCREILQVAIVLRDMAITLGVPEFAQRLHVPIQRIEHFTKKENPDAPHDLAP